MDVRALGELLVAAHVMPRPHMEELLAEVPVRGDAAVRDELTAVVARHEDAVCDVLAERTGAPALSLGSSTLDLTAIDFVPVDIIRDNHILPVNHEGGVLTVASPTAELAALQAPLEVATGRRILVVVAVPVLLDVLIEPALEARERKERVLRGARSTSDEPTLVLSRPAVKSALPRADSVARALSEVLAKALEGPAPTPPPPPPSSTARLGALKLKQVTRTTFTPSPDVVPVAEERVQLVERGLRTPSPDHVSPSPERASPDAAEPLPPLPTGTGPWALIVEDDDAIRTLIAKVLGRDGLVVEQASDGRRAIDLMRRRRPDLIILDAMLPGVHGFELCGAIKRNATWASVHVIMISAVFRGFNSARDIQEVHGADYFIEKPFDITHLRHVVADLLKRPKPELPGGPERELTAARARALVDHAMTIGDIAGAERLVEKWVQLDPFDARAWLERGNISAQVGDTLAALRAYELASMYDRRLFVAHVSLAMTYETLGFARRARATWERAAASAPDTETAVRIRAALGR